MQESSKRERMFTLVEKWKESGKTQKQFSREYGITYSKFLYWTRKYRQSSRNGNGFLPLEVVASNEESPGSDEALQHPRVEVEFKSGLTLRIY